MSEGERPDVLSTLRAFIRGRGEEPSQLGDAAQWLERSVQRMRQHAATVRFLHPMARDQLVGVGEPFELAAEVSALRSLAADRVRFRLDDEVVGEVPLVPGGTFVVATTAKVGVHPASFEVLDARSAVVRTGTQTRVHVVDERPLVLLDAAMALAEHAPLELLRRLGPVDVGVAWLDLGVSSRVQELRDLIVGEGLPDGAVLTHPRQETEATSEAVFIRTIVGRLRASGVAVVAFISDQPDHRESADAGAVEFVAPAELSRWLRTDEWRALVAEQAADLHARRRDADAFAFRLDETTGARACEGNECHVEFDNRLARESVLRAIGAARHTLEIQVYIVEDGGFMDLLSAHLIAAARRGVTIRLLVDALYSRDQALGMRNPILTALRDEPRITVRANDPVPVSDILELQSLKQRDHRKVFVFDGRHAFVSGRNAGDAYYTGFDEVPITDSTPHERIPWLDAHIEVRGPLVADVLQSFESAWVRSGGTARAVAEPPPPAGHAKARLVVHQGVEDANGMAAYEALLDAAVDHVYILNDFPIVSALVAAVRRALGRGVQVSLLTGNGLPRRGDGTFFRGPIYRELFEHMTKARLEPLMRRGLRLFEYATVADLPLVVCAGGTVRPYVHAKLMTADGRALSVGSANLDATASYWEREANVVVEDEATVTRVEAWIASALEHSLEVGPDDAYWQRESGLREVVARLWPDFVYS